MDSAVEVLSIILFVSYRHPAQLICLLEPDLPFPSLPPPAFQGACFSASVNKLPAPQRWFPRAVGKMACPFCIILHNPLKVTGIGRLRPKHITLPPSLYPLPGKEQQMSHGWCFLVIAQLGLGVVRGGKEKPLDSLCKAGWGHLISEKCLGRGTQEVLTLQLAPRCFGRATEAELKKQKQQNLNRKK